MKLNTTHQICTAYMTTRMRTPMSPTLATVAGFCKSIRLGHLLIYWGSMGGTIEAFLSECNDSYVHTKLKSSLNNQGIKKEYQGRLGRFMTDCWPRLKAVIAEAELSRTRDGGSK